MGEDGLGVVKSRAIFGHKEMLLDRRWTHSQDKKAPVGRKALTSRQNYDIKSVNDMRTGPNFCLRSRSPAPSARGGAKWGVSRTSGTKDIRRCGMEKMKLEKVKVRKEWAPVSRKHKDKRKEEERKKCRRRVDLLKEV